MVLISNMSGSSLSVKLIYGFAVRSLIFLSLYINMVTRKTWYNIKWHVFTSLAIIGQKYLELMSFYNIRIPLGGLLRRFARAMYIE